MLEHIFEAPSISYNKIRSIAKEFSEKYNPEDELPVPIESIIEFHFKIDIIPINSLRSAHDIEGFISNDFKEIYVDYDTYIKYESRYYFTLAHELGHMVLHRDIYRLLKFSTSEEWKCIVNEIDPEVYSALELQAYNFAGLILVPEHRLKEAYCEAVEKVEEAGFSRVRNIEMFNSYVSNWLKSKFMVSGRTIELRIKFDKLDKI